MNVAGLRFLDKLPIFQTSLAITLFLSAPASDGLRNIMGRLNRDGTATIWAITSTVSGNTDTGADPNQLVTITDKLAATSLPAHESFTTLRTARFAEVLRGVSFTPGTDRDRIADDRDHDRDGDHDRDRHAEAN